MILLQHFFHLVASILLATQVFSSPQDSATSGGNALNHYLALNLKGDLTDLPNSPAQSSWTAIQPNLNTPPVQESDLLGNRIANINPIDFEASNIWPNRLTSDSTSVGADNNTPSYNLQNTALLSDDDIGGVTDVLPSFPAPLIDFFPHGLPKFDPDGVIRWFKNPTRPNCDTGKFAFCCQKGPAHLYRSRKPGVAPPTAEQIAEHAQRLRNCRNWSADDPACHFPENQACCDCKSEQQIAFFCYFPRWRDDKNFQGKPQRPPLQLPNVDELVDPNPSEPYLPPNQKIKRDWNVLDDDSNNDDISTSSNTIDGLYASKPPSTEPYKHPGGRNRLDSTCSDEYLEKLGVRINRYREPAIHSPENPFEAKPKLPKRPDGRMRVNKPNPPPLPIRKPRPPPEEW